MRQVAAAVQAFGGGASFTAVGLVFLTVGALAAAAPTPGGSARWKPCCWRRRPAWGRDVI